MKQFTLTFAMLVVFIQASFGQGIMEYLTPISAEYTKVSKATWDYTRASSHSSSFRKIANKRKKLLKITKQAAATVKAMSGFNGNTAYRDSTVAYLEISYDVINDDYAKLMDLEEVKEQSYDAMEAYMMAEQIANDKLDSANAVANREQARFCKDNNVNLTADDSELAKKMKKAGEVYRYYNEIYLIFFKANVQETYLMTAINANDVAAMGQIKNTLAQFAEEGLKKMKAIKGYKGDNGVVLITKQMLTFYQKEANQDVQMYIDHNLRAEKFEKLVKAMEKKKTRSQKDVDDYNDAVKKHNKATNNYNKTNDKLNNTRTKLIEDWNAKTKRFIDKHVPK
ncbi:MAG: hypothetical protein ACJA0Q_000513 [Saprospiraceae bacterium]|jgi:hypothetical protein